MRDGGPDQCAVAFAISHLRKLFGSRYRKGRRLGLHAGADLAELRRAGQLDPVEIGSRLLHHGQALFVGSEKGGGGQEDENTKSHLFLQPKKTDHKMRWSAPLIMTARASPRYKIHSFSA